VAPQEVAFPAGTASWVSSARFFSAWQQFWPWSPKPRLLKWPAGFQTRCVEPSWPHWLALGSLHEEMGRRCRLESCLWTLCWRFGRLCFGNSDLGLLKSHFCAGSRERLSRYFSCLLELEGFLQRLACSTKAAGFFQFFKAALMTSCTRCWIKLRLRIF